MTTIYLIRHAEAEGNLYRIAHGHYNSCITDDRGCRQIRALAERFRDVPVDAVYASDLIRTQTTAQALQNSCNVAFAQIAEELGADTLKKYTEQAGLTDSYSVDGLPTAKSTFEWENLTDGELGWAGVGQYRNQVNPCALMVWMGAIANGGKAAQPYLIQKTESALGILSLPRITRHTGRLISKKTAETVAELMANNVEATYGTKRFPNMQLCAKSGTAEIREGAAPNAMFAGFVQDDRYPLAFIVVVEEGGYGSQTAAPIAGQVLSACIEDLNGTN